MINGTWFFQCDVSIVALAVFAAGGLLVFKRGNAGDEIASAT